jgi:hypothetical protein
MIFPSKTIPEALIRHKGGDIEHSIGYREKTGN